MEFTLQATEEWGSTWYIILNSNHESVNQELEKKYKILDEKLNRLVPHLWLIVYSWVLTELTLRRAASVV